MTKSNRTARLGGGLVVAALAAAMLTVPGVSTSATLAETQTRAGAAVVGTVTLVTGDRVTAYRDGTVTVAPDPNRADIQLTTYQRDGQVHVIPSDAAPLLADGRLDIQLFNVTALLEAGFEDDIPLIIIHPDRPMATAQSRLDEAGARPTRTLPAIQGHAVRVDDPDRFWSAMTGTDPMGSGTEVWLDRRLTVELADSVPQVGAPEAWAAGFDGTGATVAVLDTGIDASHPDLAGKVVAQENFTGEADADLSGHGTHVASTVAGTGEASGGTSAGVAPGASLMDGKVCDAGGSCETSAILEGMQWAAEQGADVVNMSLGGANSPGLDPLEEAVEALTASHGTLFVVAAGNGGGPRRVNSPATADAALAVGAVNDQDQLAGFSNQGPRAGDAALKPEITAPGVGITAGRSADSDLPGDAYTSLSGTSMATPHVAGAAAILTQVNPDWSPDLRKAALMGSAALPDPTLTPFAQGAGRLDVAAAFDHPITTDPAAVSLGLVEQDIAVGETVDRTVTYRNHGTSDLTLSLDLQTLGPDGPAPAGMFSLGQDTVVVPSQGEVSATLTVALGTPGPAGLYSGWLTATAGGTEVRTPFGFERAIPLTFEHIGRNGGDPLAYTTFVMRVDGPEQFIVSGEPGPVTVWVPDGIYLAMTSITDAGQTSLLVVPRVDADAPQSFTMDARQAEEIQIGVPEAGAELWAMEIGFQLQLDETTGFSITSAVRSGQAYLAPAGPAQQVPGFQTKITSNLIEPGPGGDERDAPAAYHLGWFVDGAPPSGFAGEVSAGELATVTARHAAHIDGGLGYKTAIARPTSEGGFTSGITFGLPFGLPSDRTELYHADNGVAWVTRFSEHVAESNAHVVTTESSPRQYAGGTTLEQWWNRPVHAPGFAAPVGAGDWVSRTGDQLRFLLPLFGDGDGHAGRANTANVEGQVTISFDGETLHDGPYEPDFGRVLDVPSQAGTYQLAATAARGAPASLSTEIRVVWTFQSSTAGPTPAREPLWTVAITPPLDGANTAPAGETVEVPVLAQPQPGSAAGELTELTVELSVDDGMTWQPAAVTEAGDGHVAELAHPDQAGFVSLRVRAADDAGNAVEQEVIRAYRIG